MRNMRWKIKLTRYQRNAVQYHLQAFGKEFMMILLLTVIIANDMFYFGLLWVDILDWLTGIQPFGYISALLFLIPTVLVLPLLYLYLIHRQLKKPIIHCYTKKIRIVLQIARIYQDIMGFVLGVCIAYFLFPYEIDCFIISMAVGLALMISAIYLILYTLLNTKKYMK